MRHKQKKNQCLHCDPYPADVSHRREKLENLFLSLAIAPRLLERLWLRWPRLHQLVNKLVISNFFRVLLAVKILRESKAEDLDEELFNRSLVVVRAARKKGLPIKAIKFLGHGTNFYSYKYCGAKKIFEGLPHLSVEQTKNVDFDDKAKLKQLLAKEKLPHPQGAAFKDYVSARAFVKEKISFPVVVKPKSGSLSKHTTCNVQNYSDLKKAVAIAKILSRDFIVEEHIPGDVHRITLVAGKMVAACRRDLPNVIGDGRHTVGELIARKNQDPRRGTIEQRNFTLHKITVTAKTKIILSRQDVNLQSIPPSGQLILLHDKVILAVGADIHDTTELVHPKNIALFQYVAVICQAPVIGLDFITPDIAKSYDQQRSAIIEANSLPYIDMHHFPVTGKARNVAGPLLDYCLAQK